MTNTAALKKKPATRSKGAPPKRGQTTPVIAKNERAAKPAKNKPLQVMTPPNIFDEYTDIAIEEFGNFKGAKSMLFMKMFECYKLHGKS